MPANNQTDTDAGAQSVVGTDQVDQISRALHQVRPNWAEDGHGVRGPQRPVIPSQLARPNPVEFQFPASSNNNRTPGACDPSAPPATGTYVWGAIDGVCQWIPTCSATCGAT